jgi:hypothetical protein
MSGNALLVYSRGQNTYHDTRLTAPEIIVKAEEEVSHRLVLHQPSKDKKLIYHGGTASHFKATQSNAS